MKHLDLFSGIGGFTIAAKKLNINTNQFVEIDSDAQKILKHHFPSTPIHGDIKTYHCQTGEFELITGGSPCQDFSNAGKRAGIQGDRSSLWYEMLRVIVECQPHFVVWENVEGAVHRGLREILASLRMVNYSWEIEIISAKSLGAPHLRNRIFIIAYPDSRRKYFQKLCSWSSQIGAFLEEERVDTPWLSVKRPSHGYDYGFSPKLDGLLVPNNYPGRLRSRFLLGRSVSPSQASIPLRRVLYLNSYGKM